MTAVPLFELESTPGRARRRDSGTSRDAARSLDTAPLRARIMDALKRRPMTDGELCRALMPTTPEKWGSVVSARAGLKHDGFVVEIGEKRARRLVWWRKDRLPAVLPVKVRSGVL